MQKPCAQCDTPFEAKRSTAKYCGDRCRQLAARIRAEVRAADATEAEPQLVKLTRTELTTLKKLDTVLGQQAMTVAVKMSTMRDTGSAIASLSRELDRLMLRVRSAGVTPKDEFTTARERREQARQSAIASAQEA